MRTVLVVSLSSIALASCQKPNFVTVGLASSPDGVFKAKLETLSEGGDLYVSQQNADWSEYAWLSYGKCAGAELYWVSKDDLILAYDRIEIYYYVDAPHAWGGANVRLCNRNIDDCPKAQSSILKITSCSDHEV